MPTHEDAEAAKRAFHDEAEDRCAEFDRTGRGVPWGEVKEWLEARLVRGEKIPPPSVRRLPKDSP